MKELAHIQVGKSTYDERLWKLLDESSLEADDFEELDYFSVIPFFVLAGASVRPEVDSHGDHFHFQGVRVEIEDDLEELFFDALTHMIGQLEAEDDEE